MPVDVVMPKLGLTMASGTIARWIVGLGEPVRAGEPLVEVSTDKITYEVEAPASGTVVRALGSDGDEFACGEVIGVIAVAGESDTPVAASAPPQPLGDATRGAATVEAPLIAVAAGATRAENGAARNGGHPGAGRTVASPAARRLARERGIAIAEVRGTGPRGRITLSDVHGFSPAATSTSAASAVPAARRAIFRKMTEVGQLPLAQVATTVRVDALRALIARRKDAGWTAFAVLAAARLLREHAELRIDATDGAPFARIDIGVAADTPRGLVVPVVRGADSSSLAHVQAQIVRLAAVARDGTLRPDDVGGACFSISNVGPQGVERVTPLPDPPQTAILGIGAVSQRPCVVDGVVVAAWMLDCIVSFDHRFIDGAPAARFLAAFAAALADPGMLL